MTDLIDRISGLSRAQDPPRSKINLHRFMGAERLYALGLVSAAQIATAFDLQGDESTQAAQLKANIDSYTTPAEKALYILRVESVLMCAEDHRDTLYHSEGAVNKAQVYDHLLITG